MSGRDVFQDADFARPPVWKKLAGRKQSNEDAPEILLVNGQVEEEARLF